MNIWWLLAGISLLVIALIFVYAIVRRRRSRRQEQLSLFGEEREERRGRTRRIIAAIGAFFAFAWRHKYWSAFSLFWIVILVISILYEYGIVR